MNTEVVGQIQFRNVQRYTGEILKTNRRWRRVGYLRQQARQNRIRILPD
jgi:hypothetical protein